MDSLIHKVPGLRFLLLARKLKKKVYQKRGRLAYFGFIGCWWLLWFYVDILIFCACSCSICSATASRWNQSRSWGCLSHSRDASCVSVSKRLGFWRLHVRSSAICHSWKSQQSELLRLSNIYMYLLNLCSFNLDVTGFAGIASSDWSCSMSCTAGFSRLLTSKTDIWLLLLAQGPAMSRFLAQGLHVTLEPPWNLHLIFEENIRSLVSGGYHSMKVLSCILLPEF